MPRPIVIAFILLAAFIPAAAPAAPTPDPNGEYLIISGGPALQKHERWRLQGDQHDKYWGNFVRAARIRIEQIRDAHGEQARITWLVYQPGYARRSAEDGRPLLEFITSVRDKYGLNLVWYRKGNDVINYINNGINRKAHPIVELSYFGHSNKYAFIFDYSSDVLGASKAWLHEQDIKLIKRSAFDKAAFVKSYGCHTAESMSDAFLKHTHIKMWGAVGKTDYSNISQGEKGTLPVLSSPGGHWSY